MNLGQVTQARRTSFVFSFQNFSRHTDVEGLRARSQQNIEKAREQGADLAFVLPNVILTGRQEDACAFFQEVDKQINSWMLRLGDIFRSRKNKIWVRDHSQYCETGFLFGVFLRKGAEQTRKEIERELDLSAKKGGQAVAYQPVTLRRGCFNGGRPYRPSPQAADSEPPTVPDRPTDQAGCRLNQPRTV